TLDGQPVDGGVIVFLPDGDGKLPKAGGHIEQGKYALPARSGPAPGKYRVEIRWEKKTGKQVTRGDLAEPYDETRQVVPARYNARSELTVDVGPGSDTFDFALTTK
ncbi:MAG TPA: hypothetical protein VJ739_09090, partial [Gemmataceae bacterium]|nr:hypothetical protein [Gemmataceae bacterium]